ncbi:MAG: DNA gyrase inhibitor YacG [Aureliella sp.]
MMPSCEVPRLPCPVCGNPVPAAASRFLPFCSDRCRLIDLGRWLDEAHSIPCSPADDEPEEIAETGEAQQRPPVRLPPGWHDA